MNEAVYRVVEGAHPKRRCSRTARLAGIMVVKQTPNLIPLSSLSIEKDD